MNTTDAPVQPHPASAALRRPTALKSAWLRRIAMIVGLHATPSDRRIAGFPTNGLSISKASSLTAVLEVKLVFIALQGYGLLNIQASRFARLVIASNRSGPVNIRSIK